MDPDHPQKQIVSKGARELQLKQKNSNAYSKFGPQFIRQKLQPFSPESPSH